jgi:type IV secretion system protein VirD4
MPMESHELLNAERPFWTGLPLPIAILTAAVSLPFIFTQRIAWHFAYVPALGTPLVAQLPGWWVLAMITLLGALAAALHHRYNSFVPAALLVPPSLLLVYLGSAPLFHPLLGFRLFPSLVRGGPNTRAVLINSAFVTVVTVVLLVGVGIIVNNLLRRRRRHPGEIAHGSARYANFKDLRKAGLFAPGGVFLGGFLHRGRLHKMTDDSQSHTLFVMPSGAGKSAGHIIPSLLTRTHSAFVLDPKGELYDATAGWRTAQGHRCIRLAPLEDFSQVDRWNPLEEIEHGPEDVGVLGLLAEALITSSTVADSHWDESARALFRCLALHTLYDRPVKGKPTFRRIRALAHAAGGLAQVFEAILIARHDPDLQRGWLDPESGLPTPTHPEATILARGFKDTPEKEMGSIASTLRRALALWGDPAVVHSTAESDFRLDLFNGNEPITLYCVIPYSDIHRLAPWVRILLALLVRRITHGRNVEDAPPLDLYLDEFASLGKVTAIHQILSFLRGYGVRTHIVIQSYDDLERLYGKGENISACQTHVVAATQSLGSRRFISDLGGEATVQWERQSHSGSRMQPLHPRESNTSAEARRPLITQGEVGTLGADEILIAKTGLPLIRAKKLFYFQDRLLATRAAVPAPQRKPRLFSRIPAVAPPFTEPSPPQSPSPKGRGGGQKAPSLPKSTPKAPPPADAPLGARAERERSGSER